MTRTNTLACNIWHPTNKMLRAAQESRQHLMGSDEEFNRAFDILAAHPKRVTFFGSARDNEEGALYRQAAYELSFALAEAGFAVISGGGNGIMAASNHGAYDDDASSIGFNIQLPHEQKLNPYTTDHVSFHYFFTRKVVMTFFTHACVYFPGGFGTLNELFEVITLVQTAKMPPTRIILFGSDFWHDVDVFIKRRLLDSGYISAGDENLYTITDSVAEAERLITCTNSVTTLSPPHQSSSHQQVAEQPVSRVA